MITYKKFVLDDYKDSLIVTDDNIAKRYNIVGDNVYLLPQGEAAKTFANVENLCKWFLSKNLQRDGLVTAIGGGSIGDTVGFAASVFKRGVKLTHVPTTLVAQIDSAIGGKTAIDLDGVKNAVGTFYNADTVIDVDFLKTLNSEQKRNGLGELTKYRMLSRDIKQLYNGKINEQIIKACVDFKKALCEDDPYDKNERHKLNLGHTIGHGLELTYSLPHGEAVANGLYYETQLALKLGKCSDEYFGRWAAEIAAYFAICDLSDEVFIAMLNDKKNVDGKIGFVLPSNFEKVYMSVEDVKKLLC